MIPTIGDLSLFTGRFRDILVVITGAYVYYTIEAGNSRIEREIRRTEQKCKSITSSYDMVIFAGIEVKKEKDGFIISQYQYAKKLYLWPTCPELEEVRYMRHRLSWIFHTIPGIISPVNILSQVT